MPASTVVGNRYTNPVLDQDMPDPDVIALSAGGYALVTSSFDRRPGLPLWHSDDLLTWRPVGFAGGFRADAPHDGGVWAPSIREHAGRLYIVWGDPDIGVFATDAPALEGPWSEPRLVRAGRGLIDACPIWDDDGRTVIVHAYARSRAGFANRIDAFDVDKMLTRASGAARTLIDGDLVPGCSVLEGPKVYRRDGELWIFAPAGGVATGWQYAFRSSGWDEPWQSRIVLTQGSTSVNGPHQGAWVPGADGADWFFHFQHKGWLGRVLHLQEVRWAEDGWPTIGVVSDGLPVPALSVQTPRGGAVSPPETHLGDDFEARKLDAGWFARDADLDDLVGAVGGGWIRMLGHASGAILRPFHGAMVSVEVTVRDLDGADGALVVADEVTRELTLTGTAPALLTLVTRAADGETRAELGEAAEGCRLGLRMDGDVARFTLDGEDIGEAFVLRGRRWTGAEWGLAARGEGTAVFGPIEVETR